MSTCRESYPVECMNIPVHTATKSAVTDPGERPGGGGGASPPRLFLVQTEARRAETIFIETAPPPPPPPLKVWIRHWSGTETHQICDDHFQDRRGTASLALRYRNCAEITFLMCEQRPYPF